MRTNSITMATREQPRFSEVIQAATHEWPSIRMASEIASAISEAMTMEPSSPELTGKLGGLSKQLDELEDNYVDPRNPGQSGHYWVGQYEIGWEGVGREGGRPFLRLIATVGRTVTIRSRHSNLDGLLTVTISFGRGGSRYQAEAVLEHLTQFEGRLEYVYINASGDQPRGACHSFKEMLALMRAPAPTTDAV